jgi:lysophospholipase L1-like esterase
MPIANPDSYLGDIVQVLRTHWPENRCVNIVCHGHSVPAGYFMTPMVDSLNAYPHLLYQGLKHRFPFAVINVIVTAIGGEESERGAVRFEEQVLCHRPDAIALDYGLNDRRIGLDRARNAWVGMIKKALGRGIKLLLLTPTADKTQLPCTPRQDQRPLQEQARQIRQLADAYGLGLVDSLAAYEQYQRGGGELSDLLSAGNHPNRQGHALVAELLLRWFPV